MAVTFDGEELLIILESGVTEVDVRDDLYTEWKNWQRENRSDGTSNRKYPMAFRTAAGDPLTGTLDIGGYFFLRNDLGWRIRPAEEDATILFVKNLVPEDDTLGVVVPTVGPFTVLILGLQPVTQNVDKIAGNVWEEAQSDHVAAGTMGRVLFRIAGLVGENSVTEVLSRDVRGNPETQRIRHYDSETNAAANNPANGLLDTYLTTATWTANGKLASFTMVRSGS
jgi:hypothetical protein